MKLIIMRVNYVDLFANAWLISVEYNIEKRLQFVFSILMTLLSI